MNSLSTNSILSIHNFNATSTTLLNNLNSLSSSSIFNINLNVSNGVATCISSLGVGDWCYLRQVGLIEAYKLAFDFHDDNNNARFCIRSVQSSIVRGVDAIQEFFSVDIDDRCHNPP